MTNCRLSEEAPHIGPTSDQSSPVKMSRGFRRGRASVLIPDAEHPPEYEQFAFGIETLQARLLKCGGDSLYDAELLQMILFERGAQNELAATAEALLKRFQGFGGVISASEVELASIDGVGVPGAALLKLVQAAALRLLKSEIPAGPVLQNWDALIAYIRARMAFNRVEEVLVLYLDARSRLLIMESQGRGTITHAPMYPREVIRRALELNAKALIVAHNHPSGDPAPSREDIFMTKDLINAAATMDIDVHDHVIVGRERCLSFRRERLIQ